MTGPINNYHPADCDCDNCCGPALPELPEKAHDCNSEDRRLPIDRPCSACGDGDIGMEHHLHCPPFRVEGGAQPPSQFEAWVIEAARQILAEIALEKPRLRTSRMAEIIQAVRGGAQPEPDSPAITFDDFAVMNRMRCESPNGFNHRMDSWSTSDWFTAILGELGEAANIAKKLNRVRDGIRGNKETEELLRTKLRQELGDTFVYLDLLAQSLGFTIGDAAMEVFNAKSKELGYVARAVSSPAPSSDINQWWDTAEIYFTDMEGKLQDACEYLSSEPYGRLASIAIAEEYRRVTGNEGKDESRGKDIAVDGGDHAGDRVGRDGVPLPAAVVTPEQRKIWINAINEALGNLREWANEEAQRANKAEAKVSELEAQLQQARQLLSRCESVMREFEERERRSCFTFTLAALERMRAGGKS